MDKDSKEKVIMEPVIFKYVKDTCIITLNRPKASNAFDTEVTYTLSNQLHLWKKQKKFPKQIILKSRHPVIFSAGGDLIKSMVLKKLGAYPEESAYTLKRQFEMDFQFYELRKLGVKVYSLLNGVVMGQGVGWVINNDYRISCENTMLAMPEVRIGMFADNGVAHAFSRLKGEVGRHMAVLGFRLKESQVFFSGISNCFVASELFDQLEAEIIKFGEESPLLKDGMKYKAQELEEALNWIGYFTICQEMMKRTRQGVRGIVQVHHDLLAELKSKQKPIYFPGLNEFSGIIKSSVLKGTY